MCLKDKVLKIMSMSEQMCTSQWTKVKASVTIWDYHMAMLVNVKCAKGVATAVLRVIILAMLSTVPM